MLNNIIIPCLPQNISASTSLIPIPCFSVNNIPGSNRTLTALKLEELRAHLRGEDIVTRTPMPREVAEEGEDQFELSYILDINHNFFQDRLLTSEEVKKIKSVTEIMLKE